MQPLKDSTHMAKYEGFIFELTWVHEPAVVCAVFLLGTWNSWHVATVITTTTIIIKVESSHQCGSSAAMPKGDYIKYGQSGLNWSWSITPFHFLILSEPSKQSIVTVFSPVLVHSRDTDGLRLPGVFPQGKLTLWEELRLICQVLHMKTPEIVSQENVPGLLMWWEHVKKGFSPACVSLCRSQNCESEKKIKE